MSARYRLTRLVATGGMAEVYAGVSVGEEGFEKPVAIKRMLSHLSHDAKLAQMFLAEAKLAMHLHHQNIVEIFDVGRAPDGVFLVMEQVNGWDLNEVIEAAAQSGVRLPAPLAAFVAGQVAAGLSHAYRAKTADGQPLLKAHRDVSPPNVLLSIDGEVKLADFGVAKLEGASGRTEPGLLKGKIVYTAPELFSNAPPSPQSDQFALGVVLYEMLSGQHPFGRDETVASYFQKVTQAQPAPLADVPAELSQIALRMLAKSPQERFASLDLVSRALAQYLSRAGEPATSAELAAFLTRLPLSPPFAERQGGPIPLSAVSFSLQPAGGGAPAAGTADLRDFFMDPEWQATGPTMDASGEVLRKRVTAPIAFTPPPEPPPPLELETRSAPAAPAPPPTVWRAQPQEPLELAREARPRASEPIASAQDAVVHHPNRTRWIGRIVMLLATLVVFAGFGALLVATKVRTGRWKSVLPTSAKDLPTVIIDSEPPGATVRIYGEDFCCTPYSTQNLWPATTVDFQLLLKGYRPYAGKFRGGEDASVHAKLKRAR